MDLQQEKEEECY